jgi:hypothetical protein
MNDLPNPVPLTDYWRQQVENWKNSNQSQAKFCQINELSYHRFVYWRRKFDRGTTRDRGGFVAVEHRPQVNDGLTLSLPNGLVIHGICAGNVPMVRQLLEQL